MRPLRVAMGWATGVIMVIAAQPAALATPAAYAHVVAPAGSGGVDCSGADGYRAVDLGTLGGRRTLAYGLNDLGQVVGASETGDGRMRPFLWRDGVMIKLGSLTPGAGNAGNGVATAINNRGDAVGGSPTGSGADHAVMWRSGRVIDLGTLGTESWATTVDDRGRVVGRSDHADGGQHAFLWRHGIMTDLRTGDRFTAVDMSDRAWIAGSTLPWPETPVAAVWRRGDITRIGGPGSQATAVNDRGQVVGWAPVAPGEGPHAMLWQYPWGRPETATDLGVLPGDAYSAAVGVNDRGQVLGWSEDTRGRRRTVLWWHGRAVDLGGCGVPIGSEPVALNDRGDILVRRSDSDGLHHAVLYRRR